MSMSTSLLPGLEWVDWVIVSSVLLALLVISLVCMKLIKSTADFLAGGRFAKRFVICAADDVAGMGAITLIAYFELYYAAGFTAVWWGVLMPLIMLICSLSGWVLYRFRQTRSLTMAEFFERRYSKKFRVFAGLIAFIAGIINFGIFPSVTTRFIIYYCNFPAALSVVGTSVQMYPLIMAVIIILALIFTFLGGQVVVMITDFLQGIFISFALIMVVMALLMMFQWDDMISTLLMSPKDASLLNPLSIRHIGDFDFSYHVMVGFGIIYGYLSWQGSQGYNAAALNPHEARMGKIIGTFRHFATIFLLTLIPVAVLTVLNNPAYSSVANAIAPALDRISEDPENTVRIQQTVPVVLSHILPFGLSGLFFAMMLSAFITTENTYLHSWGSIFIQDVYLPLYKKELTAAGHIRLLRLSIVGVAVFIYLFSLFFQHTEYIFMFMFMTGSIFVSGAGSCIIGGLYWKRGTTYGAWAAMLTGITLSVMGFISREMIDGFWLNGLQIKTCASLAAMGAYVSVSMLTFKGACNLDRLLHRGDYTVEGEHGYHYGKHTNFLYRVLRIANEFSLADKVLYLTAVGWTVFCGLVVILGSIAGVILELDDLSWVSFWKGFIVFSLVFGMITTLWIFIGGARDSVFLYRRLKGSARNYLDDGKVRDQE